MSVEERRQSPAPNTCAGLTTTTGSPWAAGAQRLVLGRGLASTYGIPARRRARRPASRRRSSRAAPGRAPAPTTCGRRAPRPPRQASSSTIRVPSDVDPEQAVGVRAQAGRAGDVEHALDAAHRPAHRAAVEHVGDHALDVEAASASSGRALADGHAHVVAARRRSARATCEPMNPVAPVTSVCGTVGAESIRVRRGHGRRSPSSRTPRTTCRGRSSRRTTSHEVSPLRQLERAAREREATCRTSASFYDAPARGRASCRPPRSPRSATSSRSTSRCCAAGDDIVSIHLSGGISGTVRRRRAGARPLVERRRRAGARIAIVDSETACGGLGLVALAAAAARARRATSAAEAAAAREALRARR